MSDFERPPAAERTAGRGIVINADRSRSHKLAKRHSSRVRILRYALPLASLSIIGILGATLLELSDLTANLPEITIPDIVPDNLTMDNPYYEGFGKDGSSYTIKAATALQSLKNTSLITLNGIEGLLTQADKRKTTLTAARGVYNHTENVLDLEQAIDINSETGLKAKLSRARVLTKDGLITSNEPVAVEFPAGSVTANSLSIRYKTREASFVDAVKAHLIPPNRADQTEQGQPSAANPFAASNSPLDVTSQRLDIRDAEKIAIFTGNVIAAQDSSALTTPELSVQYSTGDQAAPAGQTPNEQSTGGQSLGSGKVKKIIAKGPVTMTRGTADRVTCDQAEFDPETSTAVLTGQVLMLSGADQRASSDSVVLDNAANTVQLNGSVIVTNGKNELRGQRLFLNRTAQIMQLTSPGGRITARFSQSQSKATKSKQPANTAPAGFATFKTDPNAPINIVADQLDANDASKTAIFRGSVKATQGGFVIQTPELQATYRGAAGLSDVAGAQAAGGNAQPTELTRIEAKTKVVVTSAEGQTVHGDWAIFDTASNAVTVGGDVKLTEGKNVVRGTRLVIDMTSGQSRIETAPDGGSTTSKEGWLTQAPGGPAGRAIQGRPSAVFYPDQLKAMRDSPPSTPRPKASEAWKASTTPQSSGQGGN